MLLTSLHGYIHVEPMKSNNAAAYVTAFKATFAFYKAHDHTITDLATDNERSTLLTEFFASLETKPVVHWKPGGGPTQHRGDRRGSGGATEKAAREKKA